MANHGFDPLAVDNLHSSSKAVPENGKESTWSKVSREAYVLGSGLVQGFSHGVEESAHDLPGTGLRLATAVGTGLALTYLSRGGALPGLLARGVGAGMTLSFAWDVVKPDRLGALAGVARDTWTSANHTKANIGVVSDKLGRFAFDNALMSVGAVGGGLIKVKPFYAEEGGLSSFSRFLGHPQELVRSGSMGAVANFTTATGRQLPALEAVPAESLTAPKYGRVLTASSLKLPLSEIQNLDRLTWLKDGGKQYVWQPSEPSVTVRQEAQSFVSAFVKRDYHAALGAAIESRALHNVELNGGTRSIAVEIKAEQLKDPVRLQQHLQRMSSIGQFNWRQKIVDGQFGEIRLRVDVAKTVVQLKEGTASVALVDFAKSDAGGYKVEYPTVTTEGAKLTAEQLAEVQAIRQSPEGQRVLAETAVTAFEESVVHANQYAHSAGGILSPSYARFTRDFGIEHGLRGQFFSFLGMIEEEHPLRIPFYEQEVPALLYDAGMPLPLIERHYFFGSRHVSERTPLINFLRDIEASPTYDYAGAQPEAP